MTVLEVVSYLLPLGVIAAAGETSTLRHDGERETLREFYRRISDELLWPRILVRPTPPQG